MNVIFYGEHEVFCIVGRLSPIVKKENYPCIKGLFDDPDEIQREE